MKPVYNTSGPVTGKRASRLLTRRVAAGPGAQGPRPGLGRQPWHGYGNRVEQDERLLLRSSFGAAATAHAVHRPDYAQAAVRRALESAPGPRVLDLGASGEWVEGRRGRNRQARRSGLSPTARWGWNQWFGLLAEWAPEGFGDFPEAAGDVGVV